MHSATNNLQEDHVYILSLIDVMEIMTINTNPDISHLEEVVDIIKNFADGLHHAKEESWLFPLLGERGFSVQQGPVAVMLNEHVQGRNYVKGISRHIELLKLGNLSSLNLIYSNMLGYAELLQNHISKEDNILFRMADDAISEQDQESLFKQFEQIENQGETNNTKSDFIARIEQLIRVYNPSKQTI